ncbi:MAG: D-aminoacylase [Acidimicrobiia bacterium]|nr:D-aminoacylase [Acidimicrobiia bacterium]
MSRPLLAALLFIPFCFAQTANYDLVIRNARILDGAGTAWFQGSVAVQGNRIAAVGVLGRHQAAETIDAGGQIVAPGFIDTHSHSRRSIFEAPAAENLIRQGVTTVIEGPDGSSPVPLKPFLEKLAGTPISINFGLMVGQGTVRQAVMGTENRKATPEEIQKMKEITRQAMADGAFGLSTGLFYVPGNYTPVEEVIELARVAASFGGIHTSHMRDEADGILDSVRETIRIGEEGGLPTQLTHHKIIGAPNWGRSVDTLRLVEEARARGVDVTIDQYPYTASSTGTAAMFPQWSLSGGGKALAERLNAPESRRQIKQVIVDRIRIDRGGGDPKNIQLASCDFDKTLAGKTLADVTAARGMAVTIENAAETAIWIQSSGGCSAVYHAIREDDVERILKYPHTMIASDGGVIVFGRDVPHPRNYGTFARVLGRYARERKTLTLEEAVRRMTALPAARFRIMDRGLLRPGMLADVVVFDPAAVADKAEFGKPHQYSVGFAHVVVNGKPVLKDGRMTGAMPGQVLYGPGRQSGR